MSERDEGRVGGLFTITYRTGDQRYPPERNDDINSEIDISTQHSKAIPLLCYLSDVGVLI